MKQIFLAACAFVALSFSTPSMAQAGYDVSAAVTRIWVKGDDVRVDLSLTIHDANGNPVRGFQSTPGIRNLKSILVKAWLCGRPDNCGWVSGTVGSVAYSNTQSGGAIDSYAVIVAFPVGTGWPGTYLTQPGKRLLWVGAREIELVPSRRPPDLIVIAQGATLVSTNGTDPPDPPPPGY